MLQTSDQTVPDNFRDQLFSGQKSKHNNHICFDCSKKNPKWASVHLGIYLCLDCAGRHRQYGVMYSFIKSTNLDAWTKKLLLFMQKGGNQKAQIYFQKEGIKANLDYKSEKVQAYKKLLQTKVDEELYGSSKQQKECPKKEEVKQNIVKESKEKGELKEIGTVQRVIANEDKLKKKKKKKIGQKINIQFNSISFDDGVQPVQPQDVTSKVEDEKVSQEIKEEINEDLQVDRQKEEELRKEQCLKKLDKLKTSSSISSDELKNFSAKGEMDEKLKKFSTSKSISNSDFFEEEKKTDGIEKLRKMVSTTGQKIGESINEKGLKMYEKMASYWSK